MPFVEHKEVNGFNMAPQPFVEPKAPTWGETFGAAARMENDMLNVVELLQGKTQFAREAGFKVMPKLAELDAVNKTKFFENYSDSFVGVESTAEMNSVIEKINKENRDRELIERAGFSGAVASVAMGAISPTIFLPFIGQARGLAAAGRGAAWGLAGGAAQELPLAMNQTTRSMEETAFSLAASTALSGILGGAVGALRKGEFEAMEKALTRDVDMAYTIKDSAISVQGAPGGASTVAREASGGFAPTIPGAKVVYELGPVTRTISQETSEYARYVGPELGDAGLRTEGTAVGLRQSEGGSVENNIKTYYGNYWQVAENLDDGYAKYFFGDSAPRVMQNLRANIGGMLDRDKLSISEYRQEISKALRAKDGEHAIPEVKATAAFIRKTILDPMGKAALDAGLLKNLDVTADFSYLNRMYNHRAISRNVQEFVGIVQKHIETKLGKQFSEEMQKYKAKAAKDDTLVEDLGRNADEIERLREDFTTKLKNLDESRLQETITTEDMVAGMRANAAAARKAGDNEQSKQILKDARAMEKAAGPLLAELQADRAAYRRRLSNLSRSRLVLEERQVRKLERIEQLEEQNIKALQRVARTGQRVLNKLDDVSDGALGKEVTTLRNMFAKVGDQYDRTTARIAETEPDLFVPGRATAESTQTAMQTLREEMKRNVDAKLLKKVDDGYAYSNPELSTDEVRATATTTFREPMLLYRTEGIQDKKLISADEYTSTSGVPLDHLQGKKAEFHVAPGVRGFVVDSGVRGGEVVLAPGAKYTKVGTRGDGVDIYTVTNSAARKKQDAQANRLTQIADRLDEAEGVFEDRNVLRSMIQDGLDEVIYQVNNANGNRVARQMKLAEDAGKLAPEQVSRRIADIRGQGRDAREAFNEKWRVRGAVDVDSATNSASFTAYAQEAATVIKDRIQGTNIRLPGVEVMQGLRGSELARMLDIPSEMIEKFLENDVEKLMRSYLRTFAPDIELAKRFGTVNGEGIFEKLTDEMNMKLAALPDKIKDPEKLQAATDKMQKDYKEIRTDIETMISRLRNTYGLPDDPESFMFRAAQIVMNLNVLRFMGGVMLSAIPDAGRVVSRYGLTKVFQEGFIPMITNMKEFKVSAREARLAGGALDPILHTRAFAMNDVLDDLNRGTKFEKGLEYATNRIGIVALFDHWTAAGKLFTASLANGRILDSVVTLMEGGKSAKRTQQAEQFLAFRGFSPEAIEGIYKQITNNAGGGKVNGIWLPNTEKWTDPKLVQVYRQALVAELDDTIITPGIERPSWMNKNIGFRMISQFKSFGMSSTFKTSMAGLQQRDMAFVNGTAMSLALGTLSYYLYAVAAGGKTYEEMMKATPGKWADEAMNRSGLLGVLSEGQRVMERIPATAPYANFGGKRVTRRGGDDLVATLLGPSFDFAKTAGKVLSGLDEPTKSTVHAARTLSPYQNVFYLRRLLDQIEASVNVPERR